VREEEGCSVRDNERDEKGEELLKSRLGEGDGGVKSQFLMERGERRGGAEWRRRKAPEMTEQKSRHC